MLTDLLFDTPWWLPTSAIGIGVILLFTGLRGGEKRLTQIGLALSLLGVAIALTSYLVETDMEKAVNRTYRLVKSVNDRDWDTLRSLLDPQTSLYDMNRDAIVELARDKTEMKNIRITGCDPERRGPIILVSIRVLAEFRDMGPIPSDWQLQWQNFGQGQVLYNIVALSNASTSEEQIRSELNHR